MTDQTPPPRPPKPRSTRLSLQEPPPRPPKPSSAASSPSLSPPPETKSEKSEKSDGGAAVAAEAAAAASSGQQHNGAALWIEFDQQRHSAAEVPVVLGGGDLCGFVVLSAREGLPEWLGADDVVEVVLRRAVKHSRFAATHTRAMASVCVPVSPFMRSVYATQRVLRVDFALPTRPELAASFASAGAAFKVAYHVEASLVRGSSELMRASRAVWLVPVVDAADARALPAGYQEQPAVAVSARVGRWTNRGAMRATVSLPQRAYCPGELVPIAIALSNQSSVAVHGVFVSLSQFLWKHGHRSPASEEVLLVSSNVLSAAPAAAGKGDDGQARAKDLAVKVAMPVPTGAGTTPTWVYERYRVSHAIRVTVHETETRTKSRQLLVANVNFVLASCRGVPRGSTHMYMYNLALAQTDAHPQRDAASQYMLPPSTAGAETAAPHLAGSAPSYKKIADSDDSDEELYGIGCSEPSGSAPPAALSDDDGEAEGGAQQARRASGDSDGAPDSYEGTCVVCQERHQTHCIVPCGHRCLCGPCARLFQKTAACPVCRGPVATIIRVFDV